MSSRGYLLLGLLGALCLSGRAEGLAIVEVARRQVAAPQSLPAIDATASDSGASRTPPQALDLPVAASLQVLQQPDDDPVYVSYRPGTVTQFRLPTRYGATALLAHNSASGLRFLELAVTDVARLTYPDGHTTEFRVEQIRRFQTLHPNDPRSDFLDLDQTGHRLSVAEVFQEIFNRPGSLVLQTCIAAEGEPSWGIQFVIAAPYQ